MNWNGCSHQSGRQKMRVFSAKPAGGMYCSFIYRRHAWTFLSFPLSLLLVAPLLVCAAEVVSFPSGNLTLHAVLYKPEGTGRFPAVVYNHGSAPGMLSSEAFEVLGPVFASRGWVFFGPYRRGQGLSASAGPFIGDQIAAAQKKGGVRAGAAAMVRLLETDHLNDQLAALAWLRTQDFVLPDRVAVAGNSFGGVEAVLGAEKVSYCAAIDSAGGAQSWGAGARITGAYEPRSPSFASADFLFPGRERLRSFSEPHALGSHERRGEGIRNEDLSRVRKVSARGSYLWLFW